MDELDIYLDHVRSSLQGTTRKESDEIVDNLREHILECAEQLEEHGLSHRAAIHRALDEIADRNLVPNTEPEPEEDTQQPKLDEYLSVVSRALDVRTDDERMAIVEEMRDHLLERIARDEAGGVDHEVAVTRAIEAMGGSDLVATTVSQAHDGGSLQQALIAALPVVLASIFLAINSHFGKVVLMWPVDLAFFGLFIGGYFFFSSRIPGRKWRPAWFGIVGLAGMGVLADFVYWLILPAVFRGYSAANYGLSVPPLTTWTANLSRPLHDWLSKWGAYGALVLLGLLVLIVAVQFICRKRWIYALLCVIPAIWYVPAIVGFKETGLTPGVVFFLHVSFLFFSAIYLFFLERWNGTWSMAWAFVLVATTLSSLPLENTSTAVWATMILCIALVCYVAGPERWAGLVFSVAAILLAFKFPMFSKNLMRDGGVETISNVTWGPGLLIEFAIFRWVMGYLQRVRLESQSPSSRFDWLRMDKLPGDPGPTAQA